PASVWSHTPSTEGRSAARPATRTGGSESARGGAVAASDALTSSSVTSRVLIPKRPTTRAKAASSAVTR
ncbi:hypothetical protein, partial [Streptomyces sp. bgisy031]|uniref:hypothetical protein n=1 Tax=Streptomyces sp. bgisy031 TaxID=3413772 RepID=UPI003D725E64